MATVSIAWIERVMRIPSGVTVEAEGQALMSIRAPGSEKALAELAGQTR